MCIRGRCTDGSHAAGGTDRPPPHTVSCRVPGVSEPWFYKRKDEPVAAREVRRGQPAAAIRRVFDASGGTCGSPKVWITLVRGRRLSVTTVARPMAEPGPAGHKIRRRRGLTRPGRRAAAPDLVRRDLGADAPHQVWAADLTETVTSEGMPYPVTVVDLFPRRLIGCAVGERHDAERVAAFLHTAAATCGGDVTGVILHSDRGSEDVSRRFRRACLRLGVAPSMGRVGSCSDNAVSDGMQQRPGDRIRPPAHLRHPHRGPAEDRHVDHRFLQHPPTAQRVRIPQPDRPRTRPPAQLHPGAGRSEDLHTARGSTSPTWTRTPARSPSRLPRGRSADSRSVRSDDGGPRATPSLSAFGETPGAVA